MNNSQAQSKETHSKESEQIVHQYGDILECDHRLPNWWLSIFYGTIVVAVGYWFYFEVFKLGKSPKEQLNYEQMAEAAAEAEKLKSMGNVSAKLLNDMAANAAIVETGKLSFVQNCAPCHAANGGGGVGPNLTDPYWLHGGAPEKIYTSIREGYVSKGMPGWGASLGEEKVRALTAFVLKLRNTNVAGGKAPQGNQDQ